MKIAQVAPLFESVPPRLYGGTERIVAYLTEALVRQGHDVTLYASGDSTTSATLRPMCEKALRLGSNAQDPVAHHLRMIEYVCRDAGDYDILHFHTDYLHFPVVRRTNTPRVTTLHGRLDLPEQQPFYRTFQDEPLVSISQSQRTPLAWAHWVGTVYNGVPADTYSFRDRPGTYLAFLGRMSPEKRPDRAIDIALRTGLPIKLAAKIDARDRPYFEDVVRPLLRHPQVEYVGEITERDKDAFLGEARALLFPIDWPEPFGLVMAEALACGTPVIAWPHGAVPEVLQDGVTGFIVNRVEDAVRAVERLDELARRRCRAWFEDRFSAERMARDYLTVYERVRQKAEAPSVEWPRLAG